MLLKTNITAVAILIISGVLMAIDETNVLAIWNNIQAWTVFIIIKSDWYINHDDFRILPNLPCFR